MEQQYLALLRDVLKNGVKKEDRTGTGTYSVFGRQIRFDLSKGFPAVTTKRLFWKGVVAELIWFLKGSTNATWLQEQGVHIWDEWAEKGGELGPVYGKQWRSWRGGLGEQVDQIADVIQSIKANPDSRRHIVSAWNVTDIDDMALPPCHVMFQFYVDPGTCNCCDGKGKISTIDRYFVELSCPKCSGTGKRFPRPRLSCQLYQRSADLFLGVPFNIASYALLTHMMAQVCDLDVGEFVHTFGDAHIYTNHLEQVHKQLSRNPFSTPQLILNPDVKNIDEFKIEDCRLENYIAHPPIKAEVAV